MIWALAILYAGLWLAVWNRARAIYPAPRAVAIATIWPAAAVSLIIRRR